MSFFRKLFSQKSRQTSVSKNSLKSKNAISLETQINELSKSGISLNKGIGIEDLLVSYGREEYENSPYDTIIFIYGSEVEEEPWGRFISDNVWNFDTECIEGRGSYATVLSNITRLTGQPNLLTNVSDNFDFDKSEAQVNYVLNGNQKSHLVKVDNNWIDPNFIESFLKEITEVLSDGREFWSVDNGQASILFFVNRSTAAELNVLTKGALEKD